MRSVTRILSLILAATMAINTFAETQVIGSPTLSQAMKKHPGYVEFDPKTILDGALPQVEVNLEGPFLEMILSGIVKDDEKLGTALEGIKMVRVQVFTYLPGKNVNGNKGIAQLVDRLTASGEWNTIIRVPDEKESVNILSRSSENHIEGFALFVNSPTETVFINIAGKLNPTAVGSTLGKITPNMLKGKVKIDTMSQLLASPKPNNEEPDFVVCGTVKEAGTGKPLVDVWVGDHGYGKRPWRGTVTDTEGKYQFTTWPEEHNIVAQILGYRTAIKTMTSTMFQISNTVTIDFELTPE